MAKDPFMQLWHQVLAGPPPRLALHAPEARRFGNGRMAHGGQPRPGRTWRPLFSVVTDYGFVAAGRAHCMRCFSCQGYAAVWAHGVVQAWGMQWSGVE